MMPLASRYLKYQCSYGTNFVFPVAESVTLRLGLKTDAMLKTFRCTRHATGWISNAGWFVKDQWERCRFRFRSIAWVSFWIV